MFKYTLRRFAQATPIYKDHLRAQKDLFFSIKHLVEQGKLDNAKAHFFKHKNAQFSNLPQIYNLLLGACLKQGNNNKIQELIVHAKHENAMNQSTIHHMLAFLCQSNQFTEALALWNSWKLDARFAPTIYSYGLLVKIFAGLKQMKQANGLIQEMEANRVAPNAIFLMTMLNEFGKCGMMEQVLQLYQQHKCALLASRDSYSILIMAFLTPETMHYCKELFDEAMAHHVQLPTRTVNALLTYAANRMQEPLVQHVYSASATIVDPIAATAMIRMHGKLKQAARVWQLFQQYLPKAASNTQQQLICTVTLTALCHNNAQTEAATTLDTMKQCQIGLNEDACIALGAMYMRAKQMAQYDTLLLMMHEQGIPQSKRFKTKIMGNDRVMF